MQRVAVIGAGGLLGHELVPALAAAGREVVTLGRSEGAQIRVDLRDARSVRDAVRDSGATEFINLAAMTDVDACERSPHDAFLSNVRSVENLVDAVADLSGGYLVQISTDQVYDGSGPHRESEVRLTNYYSFSKYAGELAAARIPAVSLRTNFFGPSAAPHRTSLSDWVIGSLRTGRQITLFEDVFFSPVTMRTLCGLLDRVVERRLTGVFNVGSTEGMSKAEFAEQIASEFGLSLATARRGSVRDVALAAHRPGDMRMDVTAFESAMGMRMPTLASEIHSLRSLQ